MRKYITTLSTEEKACYGSILAAIVVAAVVIGGWKAAGIVFALAVAARIASPRAVAAIPGDDRPDGPLPSWLVATGRGIVIARADDDRIRGELADAVAERNYWKAQAVSAEAEVVAVRERAAALEANIAASMEAERAELERLTADVTKAVHSADGSRRSRRLAVLRRKLEYARRSNSLANLIRKHGGLDPVKVAKEMGFRDRAELVDNGFPRQALLKTRDGLHSHCRQDAESLAGDFQRQGYISIPDDREPADYLLEKTMDGAVAPSEDQFAIEAEIEQLEREAEAWEREDDAASSGDDSFDAAAYD